MAENTLPWIEKYRPHTLDEIISQDRIIKTLKIFIKKRCLPHILFYGLSGTGKCLAPDTPIIMYNGKIKKVQYIKVGDKLMGDDNHSRNVLSTTSGTDTMYEIHQKKGDTYIVNSDHIISLKIDTPITTSWNKNEKRYVFRWMNDHILKQKSFTVQQKNRRIHKNTYKNKKDAYDALLKYKSELIKNKQINKKGDVCDISINDYIKKSAYWKNVYLGFKSNKINCWKKRNVDLDPYMLGYWLGDGISKYSAISTQDATVLKYFNDIVNKMNNIGQNTFRNTLKKYNLLNNKHVPNVYKINDVRTRLKLLAGFLDADGYLNKSNNFEFVQKSKNIYDDIIFIARSLGLTVSKNKSKIVDNTEYYKAHIYGYGIENIPTKIPIKKARKYKHNKNPSTHQINIKQLDIGQYYGFELDGNGRFLLGDFTVTHNTSTVMACANELYGDYIDFMIMVLNVSNERGIEIVRGQIKRFVSSDNVLIDESQHVIKNTFKLVILDEIDAMTNDAQANLRKVMEEYTTNTRFCLICNHIHKINPALISRCTVFRFAPLSKIDIRKKIKQISKIEGIKINKSAVDTIIDRSNGDMRKVLNVLQSVYMINKDDSGTAHENITEKKINECMGYPHKHQIIKILESLINDDFNTSHKKICRMKNDDDISLNNIIYEIHKIILKYLLNNNVSGTSINKLTDKQLMYILSDLKKTEYHLLMSTTEYIQTSEFIGIFHKAKHVH